MDDLADKKFISFIIITKNEEKKIGACIESVLKASERFDSEVILVDSLSSDKTIEIAKRYPIKILQLKPYQEIFPSTARYIGFKYSSGRYIQFLDGDMILNSQWINNAIPIIEKNEGIAGVAGGLTQDQTKSPMLKQFSKYLEGMRVDKPVKVRSFVGMSLFKSSVLREVGTFDPYLIAIEEGELCDRITAAGYTLLLLPFHSAHHQVSKEYSILKELKKKIRYTIGEGQVFRRSTFNKKIFLFRLDLYKFYLIFAVLEILGFIGLSTLSETDKGLFGFVWITVVVFSLLWVLLEKKGVFYSVTRTLTASLLWPVFSYGFLKSVKNPDTYNTDVSLIKEY